MKVQDLWLPGITFLLVRSWAFMMYALNLSQDFLELVLIGSGHQNNKR